MSPNVYLIHFRETASTACSGSNSDPFLSAAVILQMMSKEQQVIDLIDNFNVLIMIVVID